MCKTEKRDREKAVMTMKFVQRLKSKTKDNEGQRTPIIAFLGDSVTQGCFEVFKKRDGHINTVFDKNNAYHEHLAKIFAAVYPTVPVNMINAGISGGSAAHGLERLERDVLRHQPDLVVVSFGLNDATVGGRDKADEYGDTLKTIFEKTKAAGIDVIFMTQNMMNTGLSDLINEQTGEAVAVNTMKIQNEGILDLYFDKAKEVAQECGVTVCDCYAKWKKLHENGADTTELLANKINHPTREMNWLFAVSLFETIMGM